MVKPQKITLLDSMRVAIRGIGYVVYSQRNMRIHVGLASLAVAGGIYFSISSIEWFQIATAIVLVMFAEAMNTAIEISVDLTTKKKKVRAMLSKDVSAGAVLLASLYSVAIGAMIFLPRLLKLTCGG